MKPPPYERHIRILTLKSRKFSGSSRLTTGNLISNPSWKNLISGINPFIFSHGFNKGEIARTLSENPYPDNQSQLKLRNSMQVSRFFLYVSHISGSPNCSNPSVPFQRYTTLETAEKISKIWMSIDVYLMEIA